MNNLVPLLVAIPLGVGFLIPLAIRLHPRLADVLSNLTFIGLALAESFSDRTRDHLSHGRLANAQWH